MNIFVKKIFVDRIPLDRNITYSVLFIRRTTGISSSMKKN